MFYSLRRNKARVNQLHSGRNLPLIELEGSKSVSSEEEMLNCTGDPAEESSEVKSRGDSEASQRRLPRFENKTFCHKNQKEVTR